MPRRSNVKLESREALATPSVPPHTMAPPPTYPASHQEASETSGVVAASEDLRARLFRSDAPSVETRENEVLLMQARIRNTQDDEDEGLPATLTGQSNASFGPHSSFLDVARKLKPYNDTLAELQQLDISDDAPLPELILIGDQSAGKSSLMSGLADVCLPRSSGTCTRCPIHIRLSRGSERDNWSCAVSLQQDYDYRPPQDGTSITENDVDIDNNPFPPWVRRESGRVVKPFKTIYDKTEIEDVLRWAQVATLNPSRPSGIFVPGQGSYAKEFGLDIAALEKEAPFSPNIVALEIKGPDLPDLSFYDLPGVFNSSEHERDAYIVRVVQNLARSYIRHQEAIIIWAVPMNVDPELSISLGLIRNERATTRTVGILTKADLFANEQKDPRPWLAMLDGQKYQIGHGFFITCRSPDEGLNSANSFEKSFFQERFPSEFQQYAHRCGIDVVKEFVSRKLHDAFLANLPFIKHNIRLQLSSLNSSLSKLPDLPDNVQLEVHKCLNNLHFEVKRAIQSQDFKFPWDILTEQFHKCVNKIKPTCILTDISDTPASSNTIDLTSDDEDSVMTRTPKRPIPSDSTVRSGSTKRSRLTNGSYVKPEDLSPTKLRAGSITSTSTSKDQIYGPFAKYSTANPLRLREIRQEIRKRVQPGAKGIVPLEVYSSMALSVFTKWKEPLDMYLENTINLLATIIDTALETSLENVNKRIIYEDSKAYMKNFFVDAKEAQKKYLYDFLRTEQYEYFTINNEARDRHEDEERRVLTRMRDLMRLKGAGVLDKDYPTNQRVENMTAQELSDEERLRRKVSDLGPDPFREEIQVAAKVRAYYVTAANRFVENVAASINSHLVRDIKDNGLLTYLGHKLGILPAQDLSAFDRLMEENPETAKQRDLLKGRIAKFEIAMQRITELEISHEEPIISAAPLDHAPPDTEMTSELEV